jgi:eukaryotic-like serine/threonine-protein kinase
MNRRSFPTGQMSTALMKALHRTLSAEKTPAVADTWLRGIRMVREDLDDETRMVPLPTVHRALVAFAELASSAAIPRAWKYLVEPDCLGVWVRTLRGTTTPVEAFSRVDAADSEYGRTTRWETLSAGRGTWRGRVSIAHDPQLEVDGLLGLARLAELQAVPALFGFGGAAARAAEQTESPVAGITQEFEVEWSVPDARVAGAVGAAAGAGVALVPLLTLATTTSWGGVAAAACVLGGGFLGAMRARERLRRAESQGQTLRVNALERSLLLRESREGEVGAALEGSVAAGQYRILRRMGSGATGVIYEAVRISDGFPVAIKLLRAAASDRLRREAEALGLSWHPNVVEVIDHGHLADGTAYLVMELLHGESLATRLRSKGRLSPRDLLPIAMQTCDALAAVHAAGVVHRDLKPSNIYMAVDRDDPAGPVRVKLLDFGIARVEWEETRITNTGGPLGTPGYMSPEQEAGNSEIDGRSDIFALGAMLFECLVGEPPPPKSPSGLVRMGETVAVRFDSGTQKASSFVPPAWRAIIEKAMQVNPADRYQDARSFAHDLRGVREDIAKADAT